MSILILPALTVVVGLLHASPARGGTTLPTPQSVATTDIASGEAALRAGNWARAIECFNRAERAAPLAPDTLAGLGTAHARAGHELAAIAWLRTYLAVVNVTQARRSEVLDSIVRLQVAAETRIRRTLEEGAEALQELGPLDAATEGAARGVAIRAALVGGNTNTADTAARAVPESERDELWASVARAFLGDEDATHATQAAARVTDPTRCATINAAIQAMAKASVSRPLAKQWAALARQLSARAEIVDPDGTLAEIGRAPSRDIPIRLLELGTRLGGAYERIRQLNTR
jgi:tetratricopeptide (TPR) repeat protein